MLGQVKALSLLRTEGRMVGLGSGSGLGYNSGEDMNQTMAGQVDVHPQGEEVRMVD